MRKKVCSGSASADSSGYPYQLPGKGKAAGKKGKAGFSCGKCDASFEHPRHLERHLRGHRRNDCSHCDQLFTNRKTLVRHMRERHKLRLNESDFRCQFCSKVFSRASTLFRHFKLEHAGSRHVCERCGQFLDSADELAMHLRAHEERRLTCLLCFHTFARRQQFLLHMRRHDRYKCLTCKRGFPAWKSLLEHLAREGHETNIPKYQFKCSLCYKTFMNQTALQQHKKIHSTKNRHECDVCGTAFRDAKILSEHLKTVRHLKKVNGEAGARSGDLELVCESCGKKFLHKQALHSHKMRLHHPRTTYTCHFCNYSTTHKSNLQRHIRLHLNERRFVCEKCGDAFYVRSALRDHCIYRHSDLRQHKCEQCDKTFKRASELNRHLKIHSDARPHACTCCEKSFKRLSHLKRHRTKFHNEIVPTRQVKRLEEPTSSVPQPVPQPQLQAVSNAEILILSADNKDLEGGDQYFVTTQFPSNVLYLAPPAISQEEHAGVMGADVRLSDSMLEGQPGRDSPFYMSELVRLQSDHMYRRDQLTSPLSAEIAAEHVIQHSDTLFLP